MPNEYSYGICRLSLPYTRGQRYVSTRVIAARALSQVGRHAGACGRNHLEEGQIRRLYLSPPCVVHQPCDRVLHDRWHNEILPCLMTAALRRAATEWGEKDACKRRSEAGAEWDLAGDGC